MGNINNIFSKVFYCFSWWHMVDDEVYSTELETIEHTEPLPVTVGPKYVSNNQVSNNQVSNKQVSNNQEEYDHDNSYVNDINFYTRIN